MTELTPAQRAAVERDGQDVCVIAGPGSGKTRVLVERFAWLVAERRVEPLRILAITFTEKSAAELKRRLVSRFATDVERRQQIERAWISTIDGFCARLLREHAVAAGIDPEFGVLEERYGDAGLRRAADKALERLYRRNPWGMRQLLENWDTDDPVGSLIQAYSALRVMDCEIASLPVDNQAPSAAFVEMLAEVRRGLGRAHPRSRAQSRVVQEVTAWIGKAEALGVELTREHLDLLSEMEGIRLQDPLKEVLRTARERLIPTARGQVLGLVHRESAHLLKDALVELDRGFAAHKRELGVLDFGDLEKTTVSLLRRETRIREIVRDSFDAILMDELQDTNRLQAALVGLLRRPGRFFAVGDINQSIYGFRQAAPEVFREYRASVETARGVIDELHENFRSRPEILEAVSTAFHGETGIEPIALRSARDFPPACGSCVEVAEAASDEAEAAWVAGRIVELRLELGLCLREIAVLVRSTPILDRILPALASRGLPYLITKGRNFYSSREVRDLIALLSVMANPHDEISLLTVLRSPIVALSDEGVLRLAENGSLAEGLWSAPDGPGRLDAERLLSFQEQMKSARAKRDEIAPDRLLAQFMDATNYAEGLDGRARANIDKLLSLVREMHSERPRPLSETVDDVNALKLADSEPDAPPAGQADAIAVMTVHAAKGLEFPVVFVPGMHRGVDRAKPALLVSPEGLGARWRDGGGDATYLRLHARIEERENEEANRLLYVAMTRAEERLVLSYSSSARLSNWARRAMFLGVAVRQLNAAPALGGTEAGAGDEEPIVVERPRIRSQPLTSATVSEVVAFQTKPDGSGEMEGARGAAFGVQVHRLLAGLSVREPDVEAVRLVQAFGGSDLGLRIQQASRVEREIDLLFSVEDVVLHGQIDVWFEEDERVVIVDYKTDVSEHLESHGLQVQLYTLGLSCLLGRRVDSALLCYLRLGKTVDVDLSDVTLETARQAVRRWRDGSSG